MAEKNNSFWDYVFMGAFIVGMGYFTYKCTPKTPVDFPIDNWIINKWGFSENSSLPEPPLKLPKLLYDFEKIFDDANKVLSTGKYESDLPDFDLAEDYVNPYKKRFEEELRKMVTQIVDPDFIKNLGLAEIEQGKIIYPDEDIWRK